MSDCLADYRRHDGYPPHRDNGIGHLRDQSGQPMQIRMNDALYLIFGTKCFPQSRVNWLRSQLTRVLLHAICTGDIRGKDYRIIGAAGICGHNN
jgi:hypothetical protein